MSRRIVDVAADRDVALEQAVAALRDGKVVVLPTDTVYAIVADAFNPTGTRRIFGAKRRSRRFPLPVLVRSPKQLLGLCREVPKAADRLMAAYWPGPLTIVTMAETEMPWDLGDTRGTIALRMPLDELVLDLVRELGPLAATSANLSGQPPATTPQGAQQQLGDLVEVYLDDGPRAGRERSTIVDLTRAEPEVLRPGPLHDPDVVAVARGELDPLEAAARAQQPPSVGQGDDAADPDPAAD